MTRSEGNIGILSRMGCRNSTNAFHRGLMNTTHRIPRLAGNKEGALQAGAFRVA